MTVDEIHVGSVITGPLLPEPVEVLAVIPLGDSVKLIGKGCKTGLVRDPVLTQAQLAQLCHTPLIGRFDGDPTLFRLGSETATRSSSWGSGSRFTTRILITANSPQLEVKLG